MMVTAEDDSITQSCQCTCKKCTSGWLSPRMRYRLRDEADMECELMKLSLQSPNKSELEFAPGVEYLPDFLQKSGIKEPVYVGYKTIVGAILSILENHGEASVPSVDRVSAAIVGSADSIAEFFAEGGRVNHAIEFIIYAAMESSPLGNGTWDSGREYEAQENGGTDEYWNLPKCANDLDWRLIAEKLGISTLPYDVAIRTRGGTNDSKTD